MFDEPIGRRRQSAEQRRDRLTIAEAAKTFSGQPAIVRRRLPDELHELRKGCAIAPQARRVQCGMTNRLIAVLERKPGHLPGLIPLIRVAAQTAPRLVSGEVAEVIAARSEVSARRPKSPSRSAARRRTTWRESPSSSTSWLAESKAISNFVPRLSATAGALLHAGCGRWHRSRQADRRSTTDSSGNTSLRFRSPAGCRRRLPAHPSDESQYCRRPGSLRHARQTFRLAPPAYGGGLCGR